MFSSYISKIYFPNETFCQGRGISVITLVAAKPSPEREQSLIRRLPRFNRLFFPHTSRALSGSAKREKVGHFV